MSATLEQCLRAHDLRGRIYARHSAGCCWHIVLDDGNTDTGSVQWVLEKCLPQNGADHNDCVEIGPLLLAMSVTQRDKLRRNGYAAAAAGRKP